MGPVLTAARQKHIQLGEVCLIVHKCILTAVYRVSLQPESAAQVWPVPGIPINFHAMINAEAKAMGTLSFSSGMFLLQEESHHSTGTDMNASSTRSNEIGMCGAAVPSPRVSSAPQLA